MYKSKQVKKLLLYFEVIASNKYLVTWVICKLKKKTRNDRILSRRKKLFATRLCDKRILTNILFHNVYSVYSSPL